MEENFSKLELTILKSKGVTEEVINIFTEAGITSKASFTVIGDVQTLVDITGLSKENATAIMEWAGVKSSIPSSEAADAPVQNVIIEDASIVKCTHCDHKQPKDYKGGDLCPNCGKQAEPVAHCYWCYETGTGKFCRSCGAEFVKNLDYEIAILLKREGVSKREIAKELAAMEDSEKETRLTQLRSGKY